MSPEGTGLAGLAGAGLASPGSRTRCQEVSATWSAVAATLTSFREVKLLSLCTMGGGLGREGVWPVSLQVGKIHFASAVWIVSKMS